MAHAMRDYCRMVFQPVTEDEVENGWRDWGRDQHLARGERGLV